MKKLFIVLLASTLSFHAYAGREDFIKPSAELASAMATQATALGYDLSTEDGRKKFGDYLKTERDKVASAAGVDLSTEEGRKKYHDLVQAHLDEVAKAQGFDLTTKEGRDALEKYLISSGDLAYVRPERPPKNDQDKKQVGDKKSSDSTAASSSASTQEQSRPAPPPERERMVSGSGSGSGSNQDQQARPEKKH